MFSPDTETMKGIPATDRLSEATMSFYDRLLALAFNVTTIANKENTSHQIPVASLKLFYFTEFINCIFLQQQNRYQYKTLALCCSCTVTNIKSRALLLRIFSSILSNSCLGCSVDSQSSQLLLLLILKCLTLMTH